MRHLSFLLTMLVGTLLTACTAPPRAHTYPTAAVAADHAVASEAGAEILRQGGNAVDAAVATSFTLSVVRPYSCGIGGGGFMVIHFSDEGRQRLARLGKSVPFEVALNYREQAPAAITADFFDNDEDAAASTTGGRAVGIPGTVAGLLHALDRYGSMDRAAVLAPAIRAAEAGFFVDEHYLSSVQEVIESFQRNPAYQQRFAFVWERYLRQGKVALGDHIRIPEQAKVLRLIAQDGASAFYSGPVAEAIVSAVNADRGIITSADMLSFELRAVEPLRFSAFDRTFLTMPPPSSGGIAMAQTIGIFSLLPRTTAADAAHALIEAFKHAFADRARYLGDPAFGVVPTSELLAAGNLQSMAARTLPDATLPSERYGTAELPLRAGHEDGGTSHFSIVDSAGSAVSCTETINLIFGSCLAVPEYGIILNNEMDDFTTRRGRANAFGLQQSDANLPAPGKRPLSSMTPTIVLDRNGRVELIAGGSGGPRIITGTTYCILRAIFDPELHAREVLSAPRLHHQWLPNVVLMEGGNQPQMSAELQKRGHEVRPTGSVGNIQMIRRSRSGAWQAASDPRKGGVPAGF